MAICFTCGKRKVQGKCPEGCDSSATNGAPAPAPSTTPSNNIPPPIPNKVTNSPPLAVNNPPLGFDNLLPATTPTASLGFSSLPPVTHSPSLGFNNAPVGLAPPPAVPSRPATNAREQLMGPPPPVNRAKKPAVNWDAVQNDPAKVQEQYNNVVVDTETSKQAVRKALQALETGNNALSNLSVQAEQLDKTQRNVEAINMQLDRSDRHLRVVEGFTGEVMNVFIRDKTDNNMWFANNEKVDRSLPQFSVDIETPGSYNPNELSQPAVKEMTSAPTHIQSQLAQQDEDIAQLALILKGLKGVATTLNTEVKRENEQIEQIQGRSHRAVEKTHNTNHRINQII